MSHDLDTLRDRIRAFSAARDWHRFHSPKNLAAALIVECAELLEHFQWLTEEQSRTLSDGQRDAAALEVADVFIYLLQLSDALGVDPLQAIDRKLAVNEDKYPVEKSRGHNRKYVDL
jgi:NTP pyrophosphatase (non-canonical NTP hydrolase)